MHIEIITNGLDEEGNCFLPAKILTFDGTVMTDELWREAARERQEMLWRAWDVDQEIWKASTCWYEPTLLAKFGGQELFG